MKILFYDTKSYDKESFDKKIGEYPELQIDYLKSELVPGTAALAKGYDAICAFVSSNVGTKTVEILHECGVKLILMRCAGFNNVDIDKAHELGIKILRVPGYSPEAVAEHAMGLAIAANRRIHKGYVRVRENDFSLGGMLGINFYQKTAGLVKATLSDNAQAWLNSLYTDLGLVHVYLASLKCQSLPKHI